MPAPARRRRQAGQVVRLPEDAGVLPAADHRAAARRPRDPGPAADRPLHPQRQPGQQRGPRLRLRLLQLQVLQLRMRRRGYQRATSALASLARWRCWRARHRSGARGAHPARQPDRLARRGDLAADAAARPPGTDLGPPRGRPADRRRRAAATGDADRAGPAGPGRALDPWPADLHAAQAPQHESAQALATAAPRWSATADSPPTSCFPTRRPSDPHPAARLQRPGPRPPRRPHPRLRRQTTDRGRPALPHPPRQGPLLHLADRRPPPRAWALATIRPLRDDALAPLQLPRPRAQLPERLLPAPTPPPPASSRWRRRPSPSSAGARSAPASPAAAAPGSRRASS